MSGTDNNLSTTAILAGLQRLSESLQSMDDRTATVPGHYQEIPNDVQQSYLVMQQGASLVHATSTKYTLMGKFSAEEQNKIAQDLLKGCQFIATGALVIGATSYGCCRSTRVHTKRAARAVVNTVTQLVDAFVKQEGGILEKESNLGAQKCGAVWQTCDTILNKKLPQGNRNAMRRDLFTWMMECNETMEEFEEMIQRGPSTVVSSDGKDKTTTSNRGDFSFEDFCQGDDEQYTAKELQIAKAAVALVKCSRGAINTALKGSDSAGKLESVDEKKTAALTWIGKIHDLAREVGCGMTDLGTLLYPTLGLDDIESQGNQQAKAILGLLQLVLDSEFELEEEVMELANKLRTAAQKRQTELQEGIAAAR